MGHRALSSRALGVGPQLRGGSGSGGGATAEGWVRLQVRDLFFAPTKRLCFKFQLTITTLATSSST